jgi:hypothetical protein
VCIKCASVVKNAAGEVTEAQIAAAAKLFRVTHRRLVAKPQRTTLEDPRPANWAKHSFGPWLTAAANRLHHNVLATALANKLARIAWTVLIQARSYEARVN